MTVARLRPITPDDLAALHELNEAAAPAVGSVTLDRFARLVELAWRATVAEIDGELAGFCIVLAPGADYDSVNYRWFEERYDDHAYLDRVAVRPGSKGLGIGRALYADVESATDATWFTLEVNLEPRNDASLAFHDKLGFAEVGQQRTDYGAVVSLMAKRLR